MTEWLIDYIGRFPDQPLPFTMVLMGHMALIGWVVSKFFDMLDYMMFGDVFRPGTKSDREDCKWKKPPIHGRRSSRPHIKPSELAQSEEFRDTVRRAASGNTLQNNE